MQTLAGSALDWEMHVSPESQSEESTHGSATAAGLVQALAPMQTRTTESMKVGFLTRRICTDLTSDRQFSVRFLDAVSRNPA